MRFSFEGDGAIGGFARRDASRTRGVLAGTGGANAIRMVTHADVNDIDVERALRAFGEIAKGH